MKKIPQAEQAKLAEYMAKYPDERIRRNNK